MNHETGSEVALLKGKNRELVEKIWRISVLLRGSISNVKGYSDVLIDEISEIDEQCLPNKSSILSDLKKIFDTGQCQLDLYFELKDILEKEKN